MKKKSQSSSVSRSGFVLFLVLILSAVTATLLFSLHRLSEAGIERAQHFKDYIKAYHACVSAVKIALHFLREDSNDFDGEGDDWSSPVSYNYRGIYIRVSISDECGRLNINKLTEDRFMAVAERLLENLNMPVEIAPAVADWVDRDSEVRDGGAEEFFYRGKGYLPSNAPMKSIYELPYVMGITKRDFKRLKNFLTVYGSGKVNINSASKELLLALSPRMTEEAVKSLVEARPIRKIEDIKHLPGFDQALYFEIKPIITNACGYFRISVSASCGDATVTVEAFTDRNRVLEWKVLR